MKKIWHPYWKWECYKSNFYGSFDKLENTKQEAELLYKEFLSDLNLFEKILKKVISEWEYSCEHFLTDSSRNHIAWLGQASMAYFHNVPADARSGFKLLTIEQQKQANNLAEKYYLIWKQRYKNTLKPGKKEDI